MTKEKKLFNKTRDSVEIKEDGKDVIVRKETEKY
jgi:hypothetical protein